MFYFQKIHLHELGTWSSRSQSSFDFSYIINGITFLFLFVVHYLVKCKHCQFKVCSFITINICSMTQPSSTWSEVSLAYKVFVVIVTLGFFFNLFWFFNLTCIWYVLRGKMCKCHMQYFLLDIKLTPLHCLLAKGDNGTPTKINTKGTAKLCGTWGQKKSCHWESAFKIDCLCS